jgi:hypothetical protein
VAQLAALAPQAFCDLAYLFDPRDTLRPCFYRVYRIGAVRYLYLLRLDLSMRPGEAEMVERGTNDLTPSFRGRRLFLDAMVIPVEDEIREDGRLRGFRIRQVVSETWIGESGRWAYDKKGVWMDADLTKFFTRLFVPSGTRIYPWYPYACRFKTVVETVIDLSAAGRAEAVPLLHRGLSFLEPWMPRIEAEMRARDFTEDIEFFVELKAQVPQGWYAPWERVRVQSYLNAAEMREFRVED